MAKQSSAKNLKMALKPYSAQIEILPFDDSTPEQIVASAEKLVEEQLDGKHVVLHITGGTKLMVLALQEQFRLLGTGSGSLNMVYTGKHTLDWYTPPGTTRQEPLQDVLNLKDQLMVQGYRIESDTRTQTNWAPIHQARDMTNRLAVDAPKLKGELSILAAIANNATKASLTQKLEKTPSPRLAALLQYAHDKGMLVWIPASFVVTFENQDSATYFAGGWLEEMVFLQMAGIFKERGDDQRYALNANIKRASANVPNELDAIAVYNNKTLIVECKTRQQFDNDTRDALYKLSKLAADVGGSSAQAVYVSAHLVSEPQKERAKDYGIKIFDGSSINDVAKFLREWYAPT